MQGKAGQVGQGGQPMTSLPGGPFDFIGSFLLHMTTATSEIDLVFQTPENQQSFGHLAKPSLLFSESLAVGGCCEEVQSIN